MKKSRLLILSVIAVMSLSACGGGDNTSKKDSTAPTSEVAPSPAASDVATFKVKFVADGVTVSEKSYDEGTTNIDVPTVPSKTGYSGEWESYTLNNQDITINAIYTAITYTAKFMNGTDVVKEISYTVESPATEQAPAVPTKDHKVGHWAPTVDLTKLEDVVYSAQYDVDLFTANGSLDFVDGFYSSKEANTIGVEKEINLQNGTISANVIKANGAEDDGIVFGITYPGEETPFWENEADYYFFFVSASNDAYLGKVASTGGDSRWNQVATAPITDYNEESDGGYPLAVSIEGNLIRCFVGDKCLIKVVDNNLLTGTKVGYRMGGANAKISPISYSAEVRKDNNSIGNYSIASGTAEMDGNFIKTTADNTLLLDDTLVIEENVLYSSTYKTSLKQDAGLVIGYNGSLRTFWESGASYYLHLVNVDGLLLLGEIDNGAWSTRADNNNIKNFDVNKEFKLSFSVSGNTLTLYVNNVMVHEYTTTRSLVGTSIGFRGAHAGAEFTPIVAESINEVGDWYIRSGNYTYNATNDELVSNCDGTLAWYMGQQLTPGKGGKVSCDIYVSGSLDDNAHPTAGIRLGSTNPVGHRWNEQIVYDFYIDWASNCCFCSCNNSPLGWNNDYVAFGVNAREQEWFKINDYNLFEVEWDGGRNIVCKINGHTLFEGAFKESISICEGTYVGVFNQTGFEARFKNFTVTPANAE